MRLTRAVLLGVAAWLAVVAVGSTAVWLVISRAGEGVGTTGSSLPTVASRPGSHPPSTSQPTSGPTSRPSPRPTSRPSGTLTPTATPATPPARRKTWQGVGGYVTAQCRGTDITLAAAQPDSGFAISVSNYGPGALEVAFAGSGDEGGRHSEIRGVCVRGVPRFTSRTEGEAGDG